MPDYPPEARDETRSEVLLNAKLAIGPRGEVTRVDFENESRRNRPFERAARNALLQWRFPEGSGERSFRAELSFKSPTAPPSDAPRAVAPPPPAIAPATATATATPAPAAAADAAAPQPGAQPALRPLSRVMPDPPPEVRDLRGEVTLQARLAINARGEVTRVDFDNGSLRTRPFERAARNALLQWRFPEGGGERSFRAEISFKPE